MNCSCCGAALSGTGLAASAGYLRCASCGVVTRTAASATASKAPPPGLAPRTPIDLPRGFRLTTGPQFVLERRWFDIRSVVFALSLPFGVAWFASDFPIGNWPKKLSEGNPAHLVALVLLSVLAYGILLTFLNSTRFRVADGMLRLTVGPIPWFGSDSIPVARIRQLFTKEHVKETKNSVTVTYEVHVVTTEGNVIELVTGLRDVDHALFIEQELERHLGIQDRARVDEVPR